MEEGKKNYMLYLTGILVVLVIALFIWKTMAVKNLEDKLAEQRTELTASYSKIITLRNEQMLRSSTVPFVWAIRKEMLKENYDQINEYLVRFVKEPIVKQILVVKTDGTIAVATDKKLEGTSFASAFPSAPAEIEDTMVSTAEDGSITVIAPVMGLNERLGFIYMVCLPEKLNENQSGAM